ncbi:MAG: CBS domain-containing protein [Planctomycetales bacterium]
MSSTAKNPAIGVSSPSPTSTAGKPSPDWKSGSARTGSISSLPSPPSSSHRCAVTATYLLLLEKEQRCALVMDGDRIVGIFSERDLLLRVNTRAPECLDHPVSEFMTPKVETLKTDEKIAMALHKMDLEAIAICLSPRRARPACSTREILRYMTDTILSAE